MRYAYPCALQGNDHDGDGFVVTFPDLRGAVTGGLTFKESIILAEDCLVVALAYYVDSDQELPAPSPWAEGQELIGVQPAIAAQLDLYTAMRRQNLTRADLAKRLNLSQPAVQRLLALDYRTPITQIRRALAALTQETASDIAEPPTAIAEPTAANKAA